MANLQVKDATGTAKFLKTSGAGSDPDPNIPEHLETNSAAIKAALEILDDVVSGSEAQVDVVTLPGTTEADIAAIKTAAEILDNAISGAEMQVDVVAALPAGANAIGKLAANSGVDIGDVDVLSIAAGETHVGELGGNMSQVSGAFTRPADTTAYAAKDTVSNSTSAPVVITFTNVARVNAGSGYVVGARLMTDQSTNVANYRLHLFHTTVTPINDNAAYTLLWANRASRVGHIDFAAAATEGSGSTAANSLNATVRLPFKCAGGDRNLFGILETLAAFTPASAQNYFIELYSELN
jgi:hypothetical protein